MAFCNIIVIVTHSSIGLCHISYLRFKVFFRLWTGAVCLIGCRQNHKSENPMSLAAVLAKIDENFPQATEP
jgi:hypothetical protein